MRDVHTPWTILFLLLCVFLVPSQLRAQTPCGNIIGPENWFNIDSPQVTSPVGDCADPFGVTHDQVSPYTLTIEGQVVHDGDSISVAEGGSHTYEVTGDPLLSGVNYLFFLHDGNDYRFFNTALSEPVEADYRRLAEEFFVAGTDIEPYIATIVSGDFHLSDFEMEQRLFGFLGYVDQHFVPTRPALRAGTYTLVLKEYELILSEESFFEKMFAFVFPYAHAQTPDQYREYIFTRTFSITEAPVAPQGVSSILFLPGIQSSRLYKDGVLGTEDQVWPPSANFGGDLEDLSMTTNGLSENIIYTRDVIDSVIGVGSVYEGFLNFLEAKKTDPIPMKEYTAFAYDWRYDVFDIIESGAPYENELKSLVDELERLAVNSYTGKVTIVAHSNGGLLAKALIDTLENEQAASKIDTVIFIGTPQFGTPKAIGTILHGYDQSDSFGGVFTDADTAREVINNMPGAYSLLPSELYIARNAEPIITFDDSEETALYRLAYGKNISSYPQYIDFLEGTEALTNRSLNVPVSTPAKANSVLLSVAQDNHRDRLDAWTAPDGIKVIEIVGTGLPTMRGVEYRSVTEGSNCISVNGNIPVCTPIKLLKPYAQLTKYGDQTVTQISAEGYDGAKDRLYLDLAEIKKDFPESKYQHYNLPDVPQIQEFISRVLAATSTGDIEYISLSTPSFTDEYDIEIIDSPVRMVAVDTVGNQTGVIVEDGVRTIREDIPGSQYFEFGDTKYLVIPKNLNRTTSLYGDGTGWYGLTIAQLSGSNSQTVIHRFENATVTPEMRATYTKKDGVYSKISTDLNGDGIIERETNLDGVQIRYSYTDLYSAVRQMSLSRVQEKVFINMVALAEQAGKQKSKYPALKNVEKLLLKQIISLAETYKKHRTISQAEYQNIVQIITSIING